MYLTPFYKILFQYTIENSKDSLKILQNAIDFGYFRMYNGKEKKERGEKVRR